MIPPKNRRKKGEGSIYRRPDGKYTVRITRNGEQRSEVCSSLKDAERKLKEFRRLAFTDAPLPPTVPVHQAIESWLKGVKLGSLKASSFDRLEQTYLVHVQDSPVGRSQLGNLRTEDIQRLIDDVAAEYSYSTVKKVRDLLREFLKYQVASRVLAYDPSALIVLPSPENVAVKVRQRAIFTTEELKRIEALMDMTYPSSSEPMYRHAALFVLIANTGLRAGEALALRWEDVHLDGKVQTIYVHANASVIKNRSATAERKQQTVIGSTKTKHGVRTVPLNETAVKALNWLRNYQATHGIDSCFVDCNDKGQLMAQSGLPKILKRVLEAASVPYRNVHMFRHTAATRMIEAGADVKTVSSILGHSSVGVTYDLYVHPTLESATRAVDTLVTQ